MKLLRAAIIGYGAVASIHAQSINEMADARASIVFGPNRDKARRFADGHGIEASTSDLEEALSGADAAIICSPTEYHFSQTRLCLEAGLSVLVELPPCRNASEAITLGQVAQNAGSLIQCAHTSRYIEPYKIIRENLHRIGPIQQLNYLRDPIARPRSWLDDPALHHAAHPIDLILDWFGGSAAIGQVCFPQDQLPESVSLLGRLPNGAPSSISICYRSRLSLHRLTVVGSEHTVHATGFSQLDSDLAELCFQGDNQQVYESAIAAQDRDFIAACRGESTGVRWSETIRLMEAIGEFQHFCSPAFLEARTR